MSAQLELISTDDPIFTNTSGVVLCSITDDVGISGNYTLVSSASQSTTSTRFYSSSKYLQIAIPPLSDRDEFRIELRVQDMFGFEELQEYNFILDKQTPQIFFETRNSRNELIQSPLYIENNGTIKVISFDTNNEILNADIRCNGLDIINIETTSTFEFDLKDYDLSMCDETLVVDVTSTDKAGNSLFVQQTLDIDFDQPEIHLTSSCYLDVTQAKIVIVPSCSIRISVADDSTLSRTLFIQAGSINYSAYDTILLSFNEILNGQDEMRLFITATDIVNRSVTQNFLFINQNTIDVGIGSQTCNKDEVQCVANSILDYDILLTSDTEIDISISNDYEDIPFVDTYGTVCLQHSPLNCYDISQFPYNTSELDDGYWVFSSRRLMFWAGHIHQAR